MPTSFFGTIAAKMSTPGAIMSGCNFTKTAVRFCFMQGTELHERMNEVMEKQMMTLRMFSVIALGPLDEKIATTGAGLVLGTTAVGRMVAVGYLS